jgi:hypothetical protein
MIDEQRQRVETNIRKQTVETLESKVEAAIAKTVRKRYIPLIVGGWGIAALAAAIAVVNKPLGGLIEELFLGNATAAHYAKLMLAAITLFGLILGFYARQREAREQERIKALMTDIGIAYLLSRYSWRIFDREDDGQVFTLALLADAVREYTKIRDWSTCEATAEAILRKLDQRGLVTQKASKTFSPTYVMDPDVVENLEGSVPYHFDEPPPWRKRLNRIILKIKRRWRRNEDG